MTVVSKAATERAIATARRTSPWWLRKTRWPWNIAVAIVADLTEAELLEKL